MSKKSFLKKEVVWTLLVIGFLFSLVSANNVPTYLDIPNTPPVLLEPIPNWSWAINEDLIDAFDLDDYFIDYEGVPLNYSSTNVSNISIVIDASSYVSFYPDFNFSGIRNVTFIADDGNSNTSSNLVFLFVGIDDEPPQWSSPSIVTNRTDNSVYQNDYVNFSTDWTDNFGLKQYIFSINQGAGWINSSWVSFSGLSNASKYRAQIGAAGGSTVYWRFCATDTSGNMNCTSEQSFSVSSRPSPEPPSDEDGDGEGEGGAGYGVREYILEFIGREFVTNFTVDPDFFKISLKQGRTETRLLKINNIGASNLSFNLIIEDVSDLVQLSEVDFNLLPGETKKITVDFTADMNTTPGEYFGKIIVNSSERKEVSVVIDVNKLELDFDIDVNISEKYKRVRAGEVVLADITINNLKDIVPTNLNLYIAIKDLEGNIYDSFEELFLFESSLSLNRSLTVPYGTRSGEYLFYGRISNDDSFSIDSDIFQVGIKFKLAAFLKASFIFILIALLSFFSLILVWRYLREKEKERILSLYLLLNELKNLIKEGKFDKAVELYVRIKSAYGEPVSKSALENREKLREEIMALSRKLKADLKEVKKEKGLEEADSSGKEKDGEKKEGVKKIVKKEVKKIVKPVVKKEVKPVVEKIEKPAAKPVVKKEVKPAAKPVAKPIAKPVVKKEVKPIVKPVVKPTINPAVKPVVKKIEKPVKSEEQKKS